MPQCHLRNGQKNATVQRTFFHDFNFFRSSVSSSREGSQERRLNDDFQSRPPLSRRPSWRRQSAVLQKARKFEAAYLKSQEIQKYKMRNGSNNRFQNS